jgi:NADH/NAD ratio-sensing transcriptional regulator Rex
MTDLVEHIRRLLDDHRIYDQGNAAVVGCGCGAASLQNHPRRVAQQIVDSLDLRKEAVGNEIRYVSAWFDDELTKLEGAE